MDVIIGMADRDPADRLVVLAAGREPGAVHDVARQPSPLIIGQHPVLRRRADRAMPHRLAQTPRSQRRVRLAEQPVQPAKIPAPIGAQRRLQPGRVPPARHDVRIEVLLALPRPNR
jgi:hypothetical protein